MPCSSVAEQIPYNASQAREHVDQPQEREKRRVQQQTVMANLAVSVFQSNCLVNNADQQTISCKHQQVIREIEPVRRKPEKMSRSISAS